MTPVFTKVGQEKIVQEIVTRLGVLSNNTAWSKGEVLKAIKRPKNAVVSLLRLIEFT